MTGIREVAAVAGVSVSTVSQVMSGNRPVAAETRRQVEAAIAQLDYRPHPGAAHLRSGRSNSIALVVPTLENPFYPVVAAGMQEVLQPRDIQLIITDTSIPGSSNSAIRHLVSRRVDAVVAAALILSKGVLDELREAEIPFVTLGSAPTSGGDVVHTDDVEGAREITAHLIDRGYENLAFVGGDEAANPTRQRLEGFHAALSNAGRTPRSESVVYAEFTREGGRVAARKLLTGADRPDAIVAANDLIAIGVLDVARELGLAVPGDLAVTGYDDIEAASLVTPSLTTVENPAREIGRTCARLLVERLAGEASRPTRTVALSHSLIVRDSS